MGRVSEKNSMEPISEPSASGHVVEGPDVTRMETRSTSNAHAKHWEMTLTEGQSQTRHRGWRGRSATSGHAGLGGRAS
jgi:hypothetical protein